jgi:hypothetical protein
MPGYVTKNQGWMTSSKLSEKCQFTKFCQTCNKKFPSFSLTPLLQMGSNLDYQGGRVTSTDFIPPHFWACSKPGPGFPLVYVIFFSPKLAA